MRTLIQRIEDTVNKFEAIDEPTRAALIIALAKELADELDRRLIWEKHAFNTIVQMRLGELRLEAEAILGVTPPHAPTDSRASFFGQIRPPY